MASHCLSFACRQCDTSYTSARVDWENTLCGKCTRATDLGKKGMLTTSELGRIWRDAGCLGCGGVPVGGSLCLECRSFEAAQEAMLATVPRGALGLLSSSRSVTTSAGAASSSTAVHTFTGLAYDPSLLDSVHDKAQLAAKNTRTKGASTSTSKGIRPGSIAIAGSSQVGAGPLSRSLKPTTALPFPDSFGVEWTLLSSLAGGSRRRAGDFRRQLTVSYACTETLGGVINKGFVEYNKMFVNGGDENSGVIDANPLVLSDGDLRWAKSGDNLMDDDLDTTLHDFLTKLDRDETRARNILEKKVSGQFVIAGGYRATARISFSVCLKKYAGRVEKEKKAAVVYLSDEEAEAFAEESQDGSVSLGHKRARTDDDEEGPVFSTSEAGDIESAKHARLDEVVQDLCCLPRRRFRPRSDWHPEGHERITVRISFEKVDEALRSMKVSVPGTLQFFLDPVLYRATHASEIYLARDSVGHTYALKRQNPTQASEPEEVNDDNKYFVIERAGILAQLGHYLKSFSVYSVNTGLEDPAKVVQVDQVTFLERIDNEQPPVETERVNDSGVVRRTTVNFTNEYYLATYFVHGHTFTLDDSVSMSTNPPADPGHPLHWNNPLDKAKPLGDMINAFRHYVMLIGDIAITRLQGGFIGHTFVLFDAELSDMDAVNSSSTLSAHKLKHECSSMCLEYGFSPFSREEEKGKGRAV